MRKMSVILLLSVTMFLNASFGVEAEEDIQTLTRIMEEVDVTVSSWETIHLVDVSSTELKQLAPQLKKQYNIVKDINDGTKTFMLQPKEPTTLLDHSIRIVQHNGKTTLQFVLSGTSWNDEVETYYKTMTNNLQNNDIFKNMESSTCVKVLDSDIIITGLLNDELWDKLKLDHKREQKETLQQSNYEKEIIGYTPMFQDEITVNNQAINVQMMIKKTQNEKKEVIIGTPVILNEY